MKRLFLILLVGTLALSAVAGPVDGKKARSVAATATQCFEIAATHTLADFQHPTLVDITAEAGITGLYLFNYTRGDREGFVLVSGDDIAAPVLAISDEGHFVPGLENPAFYWWVGQYQQQIAQARAAGATAAPEVRQQWSDMCSGAASRLALQRQMAKDHNYDSVYVRYLLGGMKWGQSAPYNRYCPKVGSKQAVTGCVATAYSMIMNFWKWPEHGFGSHSYDGRNNPAAYGDWKYGELSADFENTYYDWEHMGDYANVNSPDSVWTGIATLCYQVGVSLDMNYSPDGSGCWSLAEYAIFDTSLHLDPRVGSEYRIPKHFGYKYSYAGMRDSIGNDSIWTRMLAKSILDSMPVYYAGWAVEDNEAGHSGTSGHGFIIDGYYAEPGYPTLFHLNWGWAGSYDANYALDALRPASFDFTQWHGAVIGLEPDTSYHGYDPAGIAPAAQTLSRSWAYSESGRLVVCGTDQQPAAIYDIMGRQVARRSAQAGDRWNISLRPGLYLVRVGHSTTKVLHY